MLVQGFIASEFCWPLADVHCFHGAILLLRTSREKKRKMNRKHLES